MAWPPDAERFEKLAGEKLTVAVDFTKALASLLAPANINTASATAKDTATGDDASAMVLGAITVNGKQVELELKATAAEARYALTVQANLDDVGATILQECAELWVRIC